MAYCPECKGEMATGAIECPHCGYDFPAAKSADSRSGFAYSPLADTALLVSTIAAGIGLIGTVVATIFALMRGDFAIGLFWGPVACLVQMGILVVFLRVQD